MTASLRLYGLIVVKEARRILTYRSNIAAGVLSALFSLGARYALWLALFSTGNAGNSTLQETMTFFVVNDIALILIRFRNSSIIGADIRSGDIANRLIKPHPYHLYLIAASHADALFAAVTRAVPSLVAAVCFIGLLPPVSATAFFCFVVTAILGAVIAMLIDLIISYTAFWLTDYWYLDWFNGALFSLFGGVKIPMWFYPAPLAALCGFLPFQYAVYQPMGFYLGRVEVGEFGFSLCIQLFWIAALFLLERLIWRIAQRKITVQGG